MPVTGSNTQICVRVARSGFLFQTDSSKTGHSSSWMDAGSIFTVEEFQRRYDSVQVSLFTPKFTLVPDSFLTPGQERALLGGVTDLGEDDRISSVALPQLGATLLYSLSLGETLSGTVAGMLRRTDGSASAVLPEIYYMLESLSDILQYNKIVAGFADGRLYLVIAEGGTLRLCNVFDAADFTSAEYFLFLAVKKLNLNPELSDVYFRTPLSESEEISLCSYFRSVERL